MTLPAFLLTFVFTLSTFTSCPMGTTSEGEAEGGVEGVDVDGLS